MDKARLEELEETDLAPWRAEPISLLLVAHLRDQAEACRLATCDSVGGNDMHSAALSTGALGAYETLIGLLHPPAKAEQAPQEEFRDPAVIFDPPMKGRKADGTDR